jgi:predicted dehydrogenase
MKKTVCAFIGCGSMANGHLNSLIKLWNAGCRDFDIAACCDIVVERADDFATRFETILGHKPHVYDNLADMLQNEKGLDSVAIFTPHINHHTSAIMALEAGLNVITEKPLGFTMRAAKMIMDKAEETGKLLHVFENYRLSPSERSLNWAIKNGMIGKPRILLWMDVGERKWYWDWRDHLDIAGGAWTFDGGVHHSDLFQYNLGDVRKVSAVMASYDNTRYQEYADMEDYEQAVLEKRYAHFRKTRSLKAIDPTTLKEPIEATVEDTTSAILEFENGVIGTWLVTRAAPGKVDRSNVIYGSEGAAFWGEGIYNSKQELVYPLNDLYQEFMDSLTPDEQDMYFPYGLQDTLAIEWKQHFDALNGLRKVEVDAMTGYKAMAIPMAIYEAATIGAPVLVQDVMDLKVEVYQGPLNKIAGIV